MNEPPESSYSSNYIRLFICLSYFLAKRLCPNTPPLIKHVSHHTNVSTTLGDFYLQKLLLIRIHLSIFVYATDALVHDPLTMFVWHYDSHYESSSHDEQSPSNVFYSLQFLVVS